MRIADVPRTRGRPGRPGLGTSAGRAPLGPEGAEGLSGPAAAGPFPTDGVVRVLSIVVPCFDEEESVGLLHASLTAALDAVGEEYEIVFVDDGSRDATLARLRGLAAVHPRTRYVALSRNFGKEAAMLAGLDASRGDCVVLMDADLQHPPELIGRMLGLYRQGYDQVVARRDPPRHGRLRTLAGRAYCRLVSRWAGVRLLDGTGDFRLLSRRAAQALTSLRESNRFSKALFSWIGFETAVFDYTCPARVAGASKWGMRRLANYAVEGVVSFNGRPLRLALHAGLVLTALAVLYTGWEVVATILHGVTAPGYTTLLVAVVGFGGVQMVMLGLLGEYVGRIYGETKRRPHYLVRETGGVRSSPSLPPPPGTGG